MYQGSYFLRFFLQFAQAALLLCAIPLLSVLILKGKKVSSIVALCRKNTTSLTFKNLYQGRQKCCCADRAVTRMLLVQIFKIQSSIVALHSKTLGH